MPATPPTPQEATAVALPTTVDVSTTVAVIGAGRLGGVLARALRAVGLEVIGPLTRSDRIQSVDIALLAVPDSAIAAAAASARTSAPLIGHTSGATDLAHVDFGIHPLQTFTGDEPPEVFHGVGMAIGARSAEARVAAETLAHALGGRPFPIDDADRAGYHAAASFASNFVLTVLDAAERTAQAAGVENSRDLLAPLVRQTVDNWQHRGAASALTGPIARGDESTVAKQREATDDKALFDALATATRVIKEPA